MCVCVCVCVFSISPPQSNQNLHRTGETNSWRAQTNLVYTRTQEKGALTPQETDPDLPMSVTQSPAEMWISGLLQGPGIGHFEGDLHDLHYLHHSLASGQTIGREHSPTHQQKIRLKIYWAWLHPSEQDFHKPLILIHQRSNRMKTTIIEN